LKIIEPQSITGLLIEWMQGESDAERKALALAPFVLEKLQQENTLGRLERAAITDLVLEILVDAYARRTGLPSVEIVHAQRRDTRRFN
jgi:hypothetical protein